MKKLFLILFSSLFVLACSKKELEGVMATADQRAATLVSTAGDLLGSWKFKNYSDLKKINYEVSLEFKGELSNDNKLQLSGRSSVNFYTATFESKATDKSLKIGAIGRTKIAGTPEANDFENIYLERLGKAINYEFKDKNTLLIYLSEPVKEIMYFERN